MFNKYDYQSKRRLSTPCDNDNIILHLLLGLGLGLHFRFSNYAFRIIAMCIIIICCWRVQIMSFLIMHVAYISHKYIHESVA
jgi:hypothetical protein